MVPNDDDEGDTYDDLDGYKEDNAESSRNTDAILHCSAPLCDQAAIELEAEQWAKLWDEGKIYNGGSFGSKLGVLPRITVDQMRRAALSFPADTGVGADNISPRALARLSDGALESLIRILHLAEDSGRWPDELNLVLVVLIPKADGGTRPIGLFPTVIRAWMRVRSPLVRAWEAEKPNKSLYGGKGMGAQRAAWVAAFSAESAKLEGVEHAQTLIDLVKAFEKIPHHLVVKAARKHGYPLKLLRLSLAAYRLQRSIGIEGKYSRCITATRGITAGSGFATSELRLLLTDMLYAVQGRWPEEQGVNVTLYVDDLSVSATGLASKIGILMASIVDYITIILEKGLLLEVSKKKSVIVSSRRALTRFISRQSRSKSVKAVKQAKLLGSASCAGSKRCTGLQAKRLCDFKKVGKRITKLRKAGFNSKLMARAAGTQAVTYSYDICGVAPTRLKYTRSAISKAASAAGGGKNAELALYTLDGNSGTLDPAFEAHGQPIKHWALAWWENWIPSHCLDNAVANARSSIAKRKGSKWQAVTGPSGALLVTLQRIGWKLEDARVFIDDEGTRYDCLLDPPIAIAAAANRSTRRWRLRNVDELRPGLIPDVADTAQGRSSGRRSVIIDFSSVLAAIARGSKAATKHVAQWTAECKSSLISDTSGANGRRRADTR